MKRLFLLSIILTAMFSCKTNTTIFVAGTYTDCIHIKSEHCLQIKDKTSDDWRVFEGKIEGFKYQEGHEYELKVKELERTPSTPFTRYELLEILSNKVKSTSAMPNNNQNPEGKKYVIKTFGKYDVHKIPKLYFTLQDGKINGFSGCNLFNGSVKITDDGTMEVIEPLMVTRRACMDPETAQLEQDFLRNIAAVKNYKLANGYLDLFDDKRQLIMSCYLMRGGASNDEQKPIETFHHTIPVKKVVLESATRGYHKIITWTSGNIVVENNPIKQSKTTTLSKKDNESIIQLIKTLDIEQIPSLTAPSKDHQTDATKMVNMTFEKWQKNYVSQVFDEDNPPQELSALVALMLKLADQ